MSSYLLGGIVFWGSTACKLRRTAKARVTNLPDGHGRRPGSSVTGSAFPEELGGSRSPLTILIFRRRGKAQTEQVRVDQQPQEQGDGAWTLSIWW